jgi:molybdopterin-guanine dinucleotide biosynthesis protein A
VNAYVLVGGRSSRMGFSKAELFLPYIAAAAGPVFDDVFAVEREGRKATPIATIFEEHHDAEGPVFGVVAALRHAQAECFVLAVDYPLVTTEVLRYLRDRRGVPECDGHPQPLCAVWRVEALPRLEARIAGGRYDLRGAIDQEMIPEAELRARFGGEVLMNVNTPEEWERGQRFLASR